MTTVHRNGAILLVLTAAGLLLAACGQAGATGVAAPSVLAKNAAGYTDLSVEQLAAMLPNKSFTLINVHVPYAGEIPQTDLFIPHDEIASQLERLPSKDTPIVLYCRSGSMSTTAAAALAGLGYSNVMELDGGFNAWKEAGYDFLVKPQP